jgi:hypothetical protein
MVEMPIFDMIFSTPLPSAVMTLRTASSGVTPASTPERTRSSQVSIARYGLTADAPYPTRSATWCTSRTSPASTTRPTFMRVSDRMRWWCTAESISNDGIGARSFVESRSLSTMKVAPSSMAS